MMKTIKIAAICMGLAIGPFGQANAYQSIAPTSLNWAQQFKGLDGVSITCLRAISRKYAVRLCDAMIKHASSTLTKSGVSFETLGIHDVTKDFQVPKSKFQSPLNLTIHMRGTSGSPLAVDIRFHLSVIYESAVEKGGSGDGRRGELVMWQRGLTGAGTPRRLERAANKAGKARMNEVLKVISDHWAK